MELIAILRVLWRRRAIVVVGAVVSIVLGLIAGGSEPARSGIAWTSVAVDTQPSQLIAPTPKGAATLGWRAVLIGDLMLTETVKDQLALAIGVPAEQLAVIEPNLDIPAVGTALPRTASKAAAPVASYVLSVTSNEQLATIALRADAPDRADAVRLAKAAVGVLGAQRSPAARDAQAYEIVRNAAIESEAVVKAAGRGKMAAVTLVAFALWCSGAVVLPLRLGTRRRRLAPTG